MDLMFKIAEQAANGILILMVILSIVSLGIMIERYFSLKRIGNLSRKVGAAFKNVVGTQDLNQVVQISEENNSVEGRALGYGLKYVEKYGTKGLDQLFDSYKATEKPELEKNLNMLGTIASNAPYVGLLGTVMGIMKAFNDLANSPGQGNEVVMAGIAHALISTALGLAVAIPAVVAFNFFQKKVALILSNVDAAKDMCVMYTANRKA